MIVGPEWETRPMNDIKHRPTIGLIVIASITAALLAYGARSSGTPADPTVVNPDPVHIDPVILDAYREDMLEWMEVLHEIGGQFNVKSMTDKTAMGIDIAASMADADLAILYSHEVDFSLAREKAEDFRDLLVDGYDADGAAQATFICNTLDPPDYGGGPSVRSPTGLTLAALVLFQVTEAVYVVADKVCHQDAVTNTTTICIVAAIARFVVKELYDVAKFFTSHVNGVQGDTTFSRLEVLHDDVSTLAAGADAMLAKLDASLVKSNELAEENERLRATNCELLRLLLLPLKDRESDDPNCPSFDSPIGWR
jgi:hypothetical protein